MMQQKLESELMSLAHSVLKMKKGEDVKILTEKAKEIYERLAVLSFIDRYKLESPHVAKTKEELVKEVFEETIVATKPEEIAVISENTTIEEEVVNKNLLFDEMNEQEQDLEELANAFQPIEKISEPVVDEPVEQFDHASESLAKEEVIEETIEVAEEVTVDTQEEELISASGDTHNLQFALEQEFGTKISLEETTDLFDNAERISPKKTLNDVVMQQKSLQIDLNDRIAFVKYLFDNSHEDFNRVISQLNTMETEKEANSFIRMIKKEYNWSGKEVYEERLLLLVERKFN